MLEVRARRTLGDVRLDFDLKVPTDGVVALFGRSGSGKTSLVNMLAGLLRPADGRIALDGTVLFDSDAGIDLPPERRRLGYVFQEGRLFPHLDVRANLLYGFRRAPRAERPVRLDRIVDLLGIEALLHRRPAGLSGGEKQRVAIGRALLANPRLLLMDEPLASLDGPRKEEILPFIERLGDELRLPIVYVSHETSEIVRLADFMVLIADGRVAATGSVEETLARLDLRPLTGRHEAGAALRAEVTGHDDAFDLTCLAVPGGQLRVARLNLAPGAALRVRIRARDVALALTPPKGISILNALAGTVAEIGSGGALYGGDAYRDVKVALDPLGCGAAIWARITARSAHELDLATGRRVFALVKTVAIDRHDFGRRRGPIPPP